MSHCLQVLENSLAKKRNVRREEIGSVHWRARFHQRVIVTQLGAEVEALLAIGSAGCELAANRKIPAPGSAAFFHSDRELLFKILIEKPSAQFFQAALKGIVHSVPGDVEESRFATSPADLSSYDGWVTGAGHQRGDIDYGER